MQFRELGQSRIKASVVGLGTWAIGGWKWGGTDEQASIDAIKAGLDAGANFVDTAPAYGLGYSEEIVGKAIAGRRDNVVLATKCGLIWDTNKGTAFVEQYDKTIHRYLGKDSIRQEVEQSLKRMQTDYIDLLQTHWQDATTPISETMEGMLELKQEGKIRAIGACNVQVNELKQYLDVGPVDSIQEKYSMIDRGVEDELLPFAKEKGISMLAYSPLALGLLTGKIGPSREFQGDDLRKDSPRFSIENRQRVLAMLEPMKDIADHHGFTIAQLVSAWTLAQPGVTYVLLGVRNKEQAQENANAGDVALTPDEIDTINKIVAEHSPNIW